MTNKSASKNDKLKIIASIFFIFGFAILTVSYFSVYETGDGVFYGYGKAFGQFFIFSVFVFLFRWRDKSPDKKPISYQLGVAWVIAVVLTEVFLIKDLVEATSSKKISPAGQSVIELAGSISRGEEIKPAENESDLNPAVTWMRNLAAETQASMTEYSKLISSAGLDTILDAKNLVNIENAEKSKVLIASLVSTATYYEDKVFEILEKAESTFSHSGDKLSEGAYQGFLADKIRREQSTKRFFEIQRNYLNTIGDILDLAIENPGRIKNSNGRLIIEDQNIVNQYNNYVDLLTSLGEEEEQLLLNAQRQRESLLNKMNELNN